MILLFFVLSYFNLQFTPEDEQGVNETKALISLVNVYALFCWEDVLYRKLSWENNLFTFVEQKEMTIYLKNRNWLNSAYNFEKWRKRMQWEGQVKEEEKRVQENEKDETLIHARRDASNILSLSWFDILFLCERNFFIWCRASQKKTKIYKTNPHPFSLFFSLLPSVFRFEKHNSWHIEIYFIIITHQNKFSIINGIIRLCFLYQHKYYTVHINT